MPLSPERNPVTRYYHSGTRYQLTMGCDPTLWLVLTILCVTLAWTWRDVPGMAGAAVAYGAGLYGLRRLARHDPKLVKVFLQNLQYQLTYEARSRVFARLRHLPKRWMDA